MLADGERTMERTERSLSVQFLAVDTTPEGMGGSNVGGSHSRAHALDCTSVLRNREVPPELGLMYIFRMFIGAFR